MYLVTKLSPRHLLRLLCVGRVDPRVWGDVPDVALRSPCLERYPPVSHYYTPST